MASKPRALLPVLEKDLQEKMVFLSGPRQVGKTTLALQILERRKGLYLSWDRQEDRRIILEGRWPVEPALIVLDELHKYRKWKSCLKGEFDHHKGKHAFLVTGSARLNIYRRGGDSLQGRYHPHRLHPFTLAEAAGATNPPGPGQILELGQEEKADTEILRTLFAYGGFPEPFLKTEAKTHRRWQKERLERVIKEDIRDLSNVPDLSALQILADLLPSRVGAPLSLNNLRADLEVSHRAISHWVELFEQLYYCYRLTPFSGRLANAIRKERKLYLWDWSALTDPGARFENMVASHLLKLCHHLEDAEGFNVGLHYLRDKSKREVDFLVTFNHKPWFAVEAKLSEERSHSLRYFGERLAVPQLFYVYLEGRSAGEADGVISTPAGPFFRALGV